MQKNGDKQPTSTSSLSALNADREKRALIAKRLASLPDDKRRQLGERLAQEGIDIWQLPIAAADVEKPVLSSAQQRLWFLDKTHPGNTLYNLFFGLHFYGDINIDWLEKSLNLIIERHEALRTNIKEVAGVAYQDVQPFSALKIECADLDALDVLDEAGTNADQLKADQLSVEEKLAKLAKQQAEQPFDLQQDALFRFLLIRVTDDHYVGFFTIHHLIFDAYSVENFCIELSQSYRALATAEDQNLADIAIQYKDYALWQQRWSESEHYQRQLDYWQQQLDGAPERINLSIVKPVSPSEKKHRGAERSIVFPASLSQQITQLAQEQNSTLYMVMLAMFNLLLSRYSGEQDICIGTSIANRDRLETEPLIGFFVNLLVMRNQVDAQISFDEFLRNVSATATDAYRHQEIPFDKLVDAQRQQGGNASLLQVLFVMNNAGLDTELSLPGLRIRPYEKPIERARYDLTLRVYEWASDGPENAELRCHIEYDTDLFDGTAIDNMLLHYQRLFQSLFEKGISSPLAEFDCLDAADKNEQLQLARGPELIGSPETERGFEWHVLHQQFEEHSASNPEAIAVVYESESVTYGELNACANRLAHYLREQKVGAESKVGLYLDRSVYLIEAILGVLKAGAAYVPLDTSWPNTRIQQIAADADIAVVLTEQQWQVAINNSIGGSLQTYSMDVDDQPWSAHPEVNPEPINSASDAAYVIYTSGSTGVPKGVVVEHRQIINYTQAITSRLEPENDPASFGHISAVSADLGNTSLFGALCVGGSLHLIGSSRAFDPDAIAKQFAEHPVDVLKIVPGHLQGLLAAENAKDLLPKRCLILGGEACSVDLITQVQVMAPSLRIINHYGPSETTVGVLTHEIVDKDIHEKSIPIGRPLANCQTYVLDQAQQLAPTGVAGELYIGGANVARGYLNNPQQTAERFIENPFTTNTGEEGRLYRTGDRVKRNQYGEIVFLGRMDNQVKIRGYRVELGDIEAAINRQPAIVESVVRLVKGDLSDQLVAYVVFEQPPIDFQDHDEDQDLIAQLTESLGQQLPEYMVPQRIEALHELPRTANGKVDTKQLDALTSNQKTSEYREPRNEMERALVDLWQQVLKHDRIGIDDNFFALGGDSILSLQVIARAKRAGIKFSPKQFFDTQTIAKLAEVAQTLSQDAVANYDLVTGDLPLTPIQHWFFEQQHPQPQHWNQSLLLEAKQPLNIDALRQAVCLLVKHHDQLRTEFIQDSCASDIQQRVLDWSEEAGERYFHTDACLQNESDSEAGSELDKAAYFIQRVNHWQGSLNFESDDCELHGRFGQLFKVIAFESDRQNDKSVSDRLLIVAHHLLIDGVSWRVLMEDLYTAYKYYLQPLVVRRKKCPLVGKTVSFKRWSELSPELAQQSNADWHKASSAYWENIEKRLDPTTALIQPQDHQSRLADIKQHSLVVDAETTNALLKEAPKAYQTTINDLLLAALILAFAKQRDTETLYLELEGHGRESIDELGYKADEDMDISRTIGWFTSRFPLLLDGISANDSDQDTELSALIKSVKEQLRAVPVNGMPYGLLKYMGDLPTHQSPLVSFNYFGQINTDQTDESSANELFRALPKSTDVIERHPDNKVTHGLSINAIVTDGELNIAWHYISNMLDFDVKQLAADYQQSITDIVAYCGNELRAFTPADFPLSGLNQAQLDQLTKKIDIQQIQDIYPLTPMQEGLMLHTLLAPRSGIYFMQYRYQLRGRFDHKLFTEAWRLVVARHEVLRTAFIHQDDQSLQIVYREATSPVEILDWRDLSADEQQTRLTTWMQDRVEESFDLTKPTQLAITLIQIDEDRYQLVRSFHHILMDAWCFGLLLNDFLYFYQSLVNNQNSSLHQPKAYRDYIGWLQRQDIEKTEKYWRQTLAGFEAPTPMVIDSPQKDTGVQDHVTWLSEEQTAWLHEIAKQKQITVNTIVQGAWGLMLSRYSGNSDIVFGVTVAGRPTEMDDADTIIGLFINSLPLRIKAELHHSAEQYLQDILAINHQMREHEFAPLADIQRLSDVEPGKALFDSLFVYENAPVEGSINDKGIDFELIDSDNRTHTNYPITVVVYPKQQLGLQLTYDKSKFADDAVARMLEHFERAVLNIADALALEGDSNLGNNSEATLKNIEILSEQEQRQLLLDWNQTYTDYPRKQCWQELFTAQVEKTPDAVAVLCGEKSLTYTQLYQQALGVAHELIRSGVQPDDIVAVLDKRDIDLLVMIAGVLLAGAAYLPLDPKHPEQRLGQVLATSQVKTVLVGDAYQELLGGALGQLDQEHRDQQHLDQAISSDKPNIIVFDDAIKQRQTEEFNPSLSQQPTYLQQRYSPDNLAYVIYTSGSTGVPKGAMVEHRGMLNNVYAKISQLCLTSEDVIAQTASQCFDISVWQFLTGLLCGAQIRIYPDDVAHNPSRLLRDAQHHGVTILESVPSLIHSFIELAPPITTLRWLIPTGEALTPDLAKQWLTQYPQIPLMNAYGPAECADDVALWPIRSVEETEVPSIPIGTPTDNNRLYVLSEQGQLQPAGVPGEIYVAGAGVGRGYLNDPERTEAAFVNNFLLAHPQHSDKDIDQLDQPARLYRTGDLGRWRADGALEYLGRTDHQIKIRGYRIELGEVEAAIEAFDAIHLAAALVKTDPRGEQCIVAYYEVISDSLSDMTAEGDVGIENLFTDQLRQHIATTLPAYMVPSVLMCLPAIPINDNGKIDRKALPEPNFIQAAQDIAEPRNEIEHRLVELWKEILKIDRIDIHTNFFALGGHSLLAIRLHARVCQSFEVELPLRNVFERNSVAEVAEQIELAKAVEHIANADDVEYMGDGEIADANAPAVDSQTDAGDQDFEEFEL